ncbi:MAG TPA: hypothetical protein VFV35_01300 [Acidimicrobiales bacterium]|nr:hypothetical protein [Acidimicrobiales bacterium]
MSLVDDERRRLEEQRDFLLASIADLDAEHEAGDLADDDHRTLREEYTARAAAVLRALGDAGGPVQSRMPPRAAPAPPPRRGGSGGLRRTGWVALVVALAVAAGMLVARSAGERVAGDTASGSVPDASTDRIARAQRLVREGEVLEAVKVYDDLLADDPDNPVALAERGWLVSRVDERLVDAGLAGVEKALAVDPTYAEAHFYRGMILLTSKGDAAGAAAAFEAAIASDPPPDLRTYLDDALARARDAEAGVAP